MPRKRVDGQWNKCYLGRHGISAIKPDGAETATSMAVMCFQARPPVRVSQATCDARLHLTVDMADTVAVHARQKLIRVTLPRCDVSALGYISGKSAHYIKAKTGILIEKFNRFFAGETVKFGVIFGNRGGRTDLVLGKNADLTENSSGLQDLVKLNELDAPLFQNV